MSFTIAIVGRPNVGKSTLYNRLIGRREAIVDNISGVTRDRNYGESHWNGKRFNVIDTGGFVAHSEDVFEKAIREQVQIAIEEASLIVFMVDVMTGITDLDEDMARLLRRSPKKVLLAVNKVDNNQRLLESAEFYGLGFDELYPIASISGSGTGDLLDVIAEYIPESERISHEEAEALAAAQYDATDSDTQDNRYYYPETPAPTGNTLPPDEEEEYFDFEYNEFEDEDEDDDEDEDEDVKPKAKHQKPIVPKPTTAKPGADDTAQPDHIPRFAIIGQPNVGKSSLENA